MASTINASTTLGLISSADTSGVLQLQTANTTAVTVDASQNVSLAVGTANGVTYLNGSKVLTSGSALTFDGTNFNSVSASQYPLISVASTAANNIFGFRMDGSTGSGNGRDWRIEQGRNAVGQFNITDITAANTVRYSIGADGTAIWNVGAGAGSEAMRLTSTGLGIGTSSPAYKLDVDSTAGTVANLNSTNANGPGLRFTRSGTANGYVGSAKYVVGGALADFGIDVSGANNLVFGTNDVERMRLDSSGNLLVGTTSNNGRLSVKGATSDSSANAFAVTSSSDSQMFLVRNDGSLRSNSTYFITTASAANLNIDTNGYIYRSTSSLKYKTDVQNATHGLADVMALRSVTYKGKTNGDTVFGGLIAEEVHAAGLTEFVQYADDGSPDALAYGNMVSLCIKAIQEQQAQIESLTKRLADAGL